MLNKRRNETTLSIFNNQYRQHLESRSFIFYLGCLFYELSLCGVRQKICNSQLAVPKIYRQNLRTSKQKIGSVLFDKKCYWNKGEAYCTCNKQTNEYMNLFYKQIKYHIAKMTNKCLKTFIYERASNKLNAIF